MASAVSAPSSAKRFWPMKRRVQEMFELFGGDQVAQDAQRVSRVERPVVGFRLHALLQPALLLRHLDVHVLAADFAAVGLAQRLQNFAQRGDRLVTALADGFAEAAGEELAIEIPDGQAVGQRIEFGVVAAARRPADRDRRSGGRARGRR